MLAEKLAPAATTLATAYAENMSAAPPPEDDCALAERHRPGHAALSHLRQILNVLDWAATHMSEPEPVPLEETADDPDDWVAEPEPESGYDGSEDRRLGTCSATPPGEDV